MAITLNRNDLLSAPTGQKSGIQYTEGIVERRYGQTRATLLLGRPDLPHPLKLFHNLKHRSSSSTNGERQTSKEVWS